MDSRQYIPTDSFRGQKLTPSRLTRFLQAIPVFLRNCFVVWIAAVVILVVLAPPFLTYACKIPIDSWNPLFFFLAIGLGLLGIGVAYYFNKRKSKSDTKQTVTKHSSTARRDDIKCSSVECGHVEQIAAKSDDLKRDKTFKRVVLIGTIILIVLQLFIIAGARFVAGWDVWFITNIGDATQVEYFSRYPNQLFLYGAFTGIAHFLQALGISNYYLGLICLSSLSVAACVPMTAYIAKRMAGYAVGYGALVLSAIMCGLSPWIMVPYSDTFGMFFTVFILWCYVCLDKQVQNQDEQTSALAGVHVNARTCCRWFLMGLAVVIGYAIKPTVIFVFVAIIVIELVQWLALRGSRDPRDSCNSYDSRNSLVSRGSQTSQGSHDFRKIATAIIACALGVVLAFALTSLVKNSTYDVDENAAFSATHFLMMGANPVSGGVWSVSDVELSDAANIPEERSRANLAEFKNRVMAMDLPQANLFLLKKLLTNFADGTFAWEIEGDFYTQIIGTNQAVLNFYGISPDASLDNNTFAPLFQVLWLFVLVGCVLIVLGRRPLKAETVIAFTLLMLSAFLMLFEARARYLFLYLPFFIILGTMGWNRLRMLIDL